MASENNHQAAGFPRPMEGNRQVLQDINNIMGHHLPNRKQHASLHPGNQSGLPQVTRKFAAARSMGGVTKEHIASVSKKRNADTAFHTRAAYVERSEQEKDLLMLPEIEKLMSLELKEVEMEAAALPDIDSCDASNPLAVVEYVDDIYNFYRTTEDLSCVSPNYMLNQTDINEKMRRVLIEWLIEVHHKMETMDETVHLTVNMLDRFLARRKVARKQLQLVGVTAMLVACKYQEVSVPMVDDLVLICDGAYTRAHILEMEKMILETLEFSLWVPTACCFVRRFVKAAAAGAGAGGDPDRDEEEEMKILETLSLRMIEVSLTEYGMLRFRPSLIAAAAVYTAHKSILLLTSWTKCCELHTRYTEEQLRECSEMLAKLQIHVSNSSFDDAAAAATETRA